jgi:hypothetical protein
VIGRAVIKDEGATAAATPGSSLPPVRGREAAAEAEPEEESVDDFSESSNPVEFSVMTGRLSRKVRSGS